MGAEAERRPSGRSSALMAQYLRIKAQHQAAILLFRLGDFYEMFFEDAETASRVLDLTLTARNRGDPDEVPLCGFPAHAAQPYVARLLAAGHPVAICEQTEARGGGLLEREVARVVTPGTILEEESLDPAAPSLLAALATDGARYGLAAIDFATGAFRATEVESWDAAREELERLAPRELLLAGNLPDDVGAACRADCPWATAALPEPAASARAPRGRVTSRIWRSRSTAWLTCARRSAPLAPRRSRRSPPHSTCCPTCRPRSSGRSSTRHRPTPGFRASSGRDARPRSTPCATPRATARAGSRGSRRPSARGPGSRRSRSGTTVYSATTSR